MPRRTVAAWAAWDWGSASFNAVVTTFVFTRWLTSEAFVEPGTVDIEGVLARHSAWLGWGLALAGALIALIAPMIGVRADAAGRRKRWLAANTAATIAAMVAMFWVVPTPGSMAAGVIAGVALLALGNVFFEIASVAYNALLLQISSPSTLGRISGIGWGAGYVGGIVLLAILYVGFIAPEVGWFGITGADGLDIRVSVLVSALWFAIFALPVLLMVREGPATAPSAPHHVSVADSYRALFHNVAELWRTDRSTVAFLIASAVYRDGLAGVFTFGAVIASGTFGFSAADVLVFAIAANVVAGITTIAGGWLDDWLGPRRVIIASLVGLVVAGSAVFLMRDAGSAAFWVLGLLLCAFVGPAQSASRALVAHVSPAGRTAEMFGLYATTGRAASFLAPMMFSAFVSVAGSQAWGIVGIVLVIAVGLGLLLAIRFPARAEVTHPTMRAEV